MEATIEKKAKELYPDALNGKSFEDGHLGGCNVEGDPATHYPIMWKFLCEKLEIKSVVDIGCGFGYSLNFFKNNLNLEAIGVEGSPKVQELALNKEAIRVHDYAKGPLAFSETYDLTWSAEFVEHVEEKHVDNFVATFKCAKYLAMTYAHKRQSGHHHVNKNTEDYWIDIMNSNGFHYDESFTIELREKTLEDWRRPVSPVDQSLVEDWDHPYHFPTKGLFFRNDLLF
jgi:SAM-dependent methyltransferase